MKFFNADVYSYLEDEIDSEFNFNSDETLALYKILGFLNDEGLIDYDVLKEWAFERGDWDEKHD